MSQVAKPNIAERFAEVRQQLSVTGKPRTLVIIIIVVLALVIGILAAVIGRNYGDEKCTCIGVNDSGFRAFSIAMIAVGIPMLVIIMLFFGCTTSQ